MAERNGMVEKRGAGLWLTHLGLIIGVAFIFFPIWLAFVASNECEGQSSACVREAGSTDGSVCIFNSSVGPGGGHLVLDFLQTVAGAFGGAGRKPLAVDDGGGHLKLKAADRHDQNQVGQVVGKKGPKGVQVPPGEQAYVFHALRGRIAVAFSQFFCEASPAGFYSTRRCNS